jgi:hypothetical protein
MFSSKLISPVNLIVSDILSVALERSRDILRAKLDPSNSSSQTKLTEEVETMVKKAQSKLNRIF